jgi:23S rRNA pseudouridine1911/1915/1917 synthase
MRLTADAHERLDRFLARRLPNHSRTRLVRLIGTGEVTVSGRIEKPSFLLEPGTEVELTEPEQSPAHDLSPSDLPLEVLFEDVDLLVVNKPRGLATHPASSLKEPSLVNALLGRRTELSSAAGDFRPGIVHRLDKETTGLLVVAKNDASHVRLARQIEGKSAERRYFAVVAGNVERPRFVIDAPIARNKSNRILMAVDAEGKRAVTHVKLLHRLQQGTALGVRLETGRTHQIRVHLSAVGLPVIGDRLYAPKAMAMGPLQLHAAYLAFDHPTTGERMGFYAPPDDQLIGSRVFTREELEEF